MTDSPMMECKRALVEADGDMVAAVDILRKNGLAFLVKVLSISATEKWKQRLLIFFQMIESVLDKPSFS